jgi:acyl CoA:acetate/3-ketoacid CoA transferase alpha subunit
MEYNCNHCGALKFNSVSALSNHQHKIIYFSSQRNLEHTCKRVKSTNLQAFEPTQGLQQENLQQSTFSFPSLVMVGLMLLLSS